MSDTATVQPALPVRALAEFLGTALLVVGGVGTAVAAPDTGTVGIALGFGLSLLVLGHRGKLRKLGAILEDETFAGYGIVEAEADCVAEATVTGLGVGRMSELGFGGETPAEEGAPERVDVTAPVAEEVPSTTAY